MVFRTVGNPDNPAIIFFHAMGVTGDSSEHLSAFLDKKYFCIMPTSSVYSNGMYISKKDEVRQIEEFLKKTGVNEISLVVASSIGADLAMEFLYSSSVPVSYVFFDGGQFAQISRSARHIMTPFLYFAIKSIYWSKGRTLRYLMWCSDDGIKKYFMDGGRLLTYGNLRRQLSDSLEDKPFQQFPPQVQRKMFFEFGSLEEHFKYRPAVKAAYPEAHFPVFRDKKHMEFQIRDPERFASMLDFIAEHGELPALEFSEEE